MSVTRLLILGWVRIAQPVHGYEVRRELLSWKVDEWANLQPGSIYHALKKMTEEGLLAEAEREQVGGRPARTPYRITAQGERYFQETLREHWWMYRSPQDPFIAALSYLPALSPKEAAAALRNRAQQLRVACDGMRAQLDGGFMGEGKPPHVLEIFRLWIARSAGEIEWCADLADRVERGELKASWESSNQN
jgi:DNA-binding PadR family transcriptional regulator